MFLGLIGVVMASSVADAFMGSGARDAEDPDDAGSGAGGMQPAGGSGTETGGHVQDLLQALADEDAAESVSDPAAGATMVPPESADEDIDATIEASARSSADIEAARQPTVLGNDAESNWYEEEFLSTDTPLPPPVDSVAVVAGDGPPTAGGAGDDTIIGGGADDWIDGLDGDDSLIGGGGNDTLIGGTGSDILFGGAGGDDLSAGAGGGILAGEAGDDRLTGGAEADLLFGGTGDDTLSGGWGNDMLAGGTGADLLMGGAGDDTLLGYTPDAEGADIDGADFLNAGEGDDFLVLGSGDIASGGGGGGADTFVLGCWIDPEAPVQISDFDPAEDSLVVAYSANGVSPDVSSSYDSEAGALLVYADGNLLAVLPGVEALASETLSMMPVSGGGAR
ncbi:calcium-binding protein [Pararhodobacter oceanensis]|uniref:calcium-binding protein n=1 Tax=Pararhodobacter oceanensis TaxID=2172121 RepID=UPI003A91F0FE